MKGLQETAYCQQSKGICTLQEEAEEEYKRLFPDHSESFAAFERPPTAFSDMEVELSETANADTAKSSAGQSLLRGRLLNEIVELQQRYTYCLPLYEMKCAFMH